ncbi:MAG: ATPase [Myxococcota bacterium]
MPHVLLVEPHLLDQRPFLRGLVRLGVRVTGIGSLPGAQLDGELRHLLAAYEHVSSPRDVEALTAAVRRVQERGPWVDRLETTLERLLLPTALAREATSIPGESSAAVLATHDRWACRQKLRAAGVYTLPDAEVTTAEAALAFAERVGYPVMLKPKVSAGLLVDLHRLDDAESLVAAVSRVSDPRHYLLEPFVQGHEGFFDSLVVDGEVVFEAATHFYPGVRAALTDASINPIVVHTNRLHEDGYAELRASNRAAVKALGVTTSALHLAWFSGPAGKWVTEVGLHPPPCELWDLFGEGADFDLYTTWASAVSQGKLPARPHTTHAAGLVNIRPDRGGVIVGYDGVEPMQREYGGLIVRMHLPPPGTPVMPIGGGYLANAHVWVKHRDYDQLRAILTDIGQRVRVYASG